MLFQVAALLVREWASRELIGAGIDTLVARQQSAWAGFVVLMLLGWPLLSRHRADLRRIFAWPVNRLELVAVAVAIGVSMRIVSWGLVLVRSTPVENALFAAEDGYGLLTRWQCPDPELVMLIVLTLAIVTPVFEETVHRGLVLGTLLMSGSRNALFISALLFAVLHRPDDLAIAFAFGMVAGVFLCTCRTLWGPITAHVTFNGISLIDNHCLQFLDLELRILAMPPESRVITGGLLAAAFLWLAFWLARPADAGG
jgi:membrane protease YdiL (CAAX protease family)